MRFRQITVPKVLGKLKLAADGLFPSEVQGVVVDMGSATSIGPLEPVSLWRDTNISRAVLKTQQGTRSLLGFSQLNYETFCQEMAKIRMAK
jgi:hypothetical protein